MGFLLAGKTQQYKLLMWTAKEIYCTGTHEVEVQFYRIQWRWWWDNMAIISAILRRMNTIS